MDVSFPASAKAAVSKKLVFNTTQTPEAQLRAYMLNATKRVVEKLRDTNDVLSSSLDKPLASALVQNGKHISMRNSCRAFKKKENTLKVPKTLAQPLGNLRDYRDFREVIGKRHIEKCSGSKRGLAKAPVSNPGSDNESDHMDGVRDLHKNRCDTLHKDERKAHKNHTQTQKEEHKDRVNKKSRGGSKETPRTSVGARPRTGGSTTKLRQIYLASNDKTDRKYLVPLLK